VRERRKASDGRLRSQSYDLQAALGWRRDSTGSRKGYSDHPLLGATTREPRVAGATAGLTAGPNTKLDSGAFGRDRLAASAASGRLPIEEQAVDERLLPVEIYGGGRALYELPELEIELVLRVGDLPEHVLGIV
jgi:hypothetical protein